MSHAVYPGSFDPITLGHVNIIHRVRTQFDRLTILIANSSSKTYLFTPQERKSLVEKSLPDLQNVEIDFFDGLTVNYLRLKDAKVIIRGLRTLSDFDFEMAMAHINKKLFPESETFLIFASPEYQAISSRMVKEAAGFGANLKDLLPAVVEKAMHQKLKSGPSK